MGIVAVKLEIVNWVILAIGITSRGIEQISGWLAGMASTVVTAPTNGQVQVQGTRVNHTICHTTSNNTNNRLSTGNSNGAAEGQRLVEQQGERRGSGSDKVASTKVRSR